MYSVCVCIYVFIVVNLNFIEKIAISKISSSFTGTSPVIARIFGLRGSQIMGRTFEPLRTHWEQPSEIQANPFSAQF